MIENFEDKGYIYKEENPTKKRPREEVSEEEPPKKVRKISDLSQTLVSSSEDTNLLAMLVSKISRLEEQLQSLKEQSKGNSENNAAKSIIQDKTE